MTEASMDFRGYVAKNCTFGVAVFRGGNGIPLRTHPYFNVAGTKKQLLVIKTHLSAININTSLTRHSDGHYQLQIQSISGCKETAEFFKTFDWGERLSSFAVWYKICTMFFLGRHREQSGVAEILLLREQISKRPAPNRVPFFEILA